MRILVTMHPLSSLQPNRAMAANPAHTHMHVRAEGLFDKARSVSGILGKTNRVILKDVPEDNAEISLPIYGTAKMRADLKETTANRLVYRGVFGDGTRFKIMIATNGLTDDAKKSRPPIHHPSLHRPP